MPKIIVKDEAGLERIIEIQSFSSQFTTEEILKARTVRIEQDPRLKAHLSHFRKAGISQEEMERRIMSQLKQNQEQEKQPEKSPLSKEIEHIPQHKQEDERIFSYSPGQETKGTNVYGMHDSNKGHSVEIPCPCGQTVKLNDSPKEMAKESLNEMAKSQYGSAPLGKNTEPVDTYALQQDKSPSEQYLPKESNAPNYTP